MRIDIHLHVHSDPLLMLRIGQLHDSLQLLSSRIRSMSTQLETLAAAVAANSSVTQSAVQLLSGLAAQVAALKEDPAALQALADQVTASSQALAEAITTNTPAA